MTEQSQRRNAFIWLFIAILGIIACLTPMMRNISIEEGAPAYVFIGGLLIILGLITARIYFRRAKVLAGMMSPERFLAHWIEDAGTPDQLEATISTEGMIFGKGLYTFKGYSCRLEDVELAKKDGADRLRFTLSTPRKHGNRSKQYRSIAVPPGEMANAQRIIETLKSKYGF